MTAVVVAGHPSLYVDLLLAVLSDHDYEVALGPPVAGELTRMLDRRGADLCLIDHRQPFSCAPTGLVESAALAHHGRTRVIVVSAERSRAVVDAALAAGALGYLHTSCGLGRLLEAMVQVQAGRTAVSVPPPASRSSRSKTSETHRLAAALTPRERECLALLVEGASTAAMASRLSISALTVRSHVQGILYKLGAHSRLEVASIAVRHGLLEGSSGISRVG